MELSRMKRLRFGVWSVALVGVLAAGEARAEKDRYDVGEQVPSFTLKAVNGEDVGETYISIDRYFGAGAKDPKKAVLMSFFATYCEPCKKEIPLLSALYESYKAKGLQVVLVSIDKEAEKIDVAKALAKEAGVTFPVLSDRFNIVAKRYFISKLPNVYLLDAEGKVGMVNVGYNDDISRKLVDEIRKSLGEPTSEPPPASISKHMGKGGGATVVVPVHDGAAPEPAPGAITASDPAAKDPTPEKAGAVPEDDKTKGKAKAKAKAKGKKKGK
jgi:alkyl hydroperoxide reductase subunit AhpC